MSSPSRLAILVLAAGAVVVGALGLVQVFAPSRWIWGVTKWDDFWIALLSGLVVVVTAGAAATLLVEWRLKAFEVERENRLRQANCERDLRSLRDRIVHRLNFIFDPSVFGMPANSNELAGLLEGQPLAQWREALPSDPLLPKLSYFNMLYEQFGSSADTLKHTVSQALDDYRRTASQQASMAGGDQLTSEMQEAFCFELLVTEHAINETYRTGRNSAFSEQGRELLSKNEINRATDDIRWRLRVEPDTLPGLTTLYDAVKETDFGNKVVFYRYFRDQLKTETEEIHNVAYRSWSSEVNANSREVAEQAFRRLLSPQTAERSADQTYQALVNFFWPQMLPEDRAWLAMRLHKSVDDLDRMVVTS